VTPALLSVASAALIAAWPGARARADGAVLVVGKVSPRDREVIVDTVRGEGTALALKFSSSIFSRDAADAAVACLKDRTPWSCVASAIRGKDQLVIVEVDSDLGAGAPMTIVTAHLLTAGAEDETFANRNCAMCNEDALKRAVGDLSRDLLQRAATRTGRTRLAIHTAPGGAQVMLDGAPAGAAGDTMVTYPGRHTVLVQLRGHAPLTRDVVAIDGKTIELSIDLAPARIRRDDRPSQFLPGLAIGVGGAAMAVGGLMILFDQDPQPRGPQQPHFYDTATAGTVSFAAGLVLASAGLYFALRPAATSTATVAPVPGGAAIGWAGRF